MTTTRRFKAHTAFRVQGIDFRVVPGVKHADDLRLDWHIDGSWWPVPLDIVGLIVDFVHENENVLYPPPYAGGGKVLRYTLQAAREGFLQANHDLHLERARKHHPDEHPKAAS